MESIAEIVGKALEHALRPIQGRLDAIERRPGPPQLRRLSPGQSALGSRSVADADGAMPGSALAAGSSTPSLGSFALPGSALAAGLSDSQRLSLSAGDPVSSASRTVVRPGSAFAAGSTEHTRLSLSTGDPLSSASRTVVQSGSALAASSTDLVSSAWRTVILPGSFCLAHSAWLILPGSAFAACYS